MFVFIIYIGTFETNCVLNLNNNFFFQTLASLLYKAGTECGYVNHKSLLEILGVSERQAYLGSLPKGLFEVIRKVFTTIP